MTSSNAAARPLQGLKVLDASSIIAGPMIGGVLGDYGADVVKIEHPNGDDSRNLGSSENSTDLWWKFLNRGKRCVTLNLGSPDGAEAFAEMAKDADVVIENFRPGRFDAWGLTYDRLSADNHGLLLLRLTGFGQEGPYAQRPGFGTLAEAMSGVAHLTGEPDGPPILPGFALGDMLAGIIGAAAAGFALWARDRPDGTQRGCEIDLSLTGSLLYVLGPQMVEFDRLERSPIRRGNSAGRWPRNTHQCSDGAWIAYSAVSFRMVRRLLEAVEHGEDPRFADAEKAQTHGAVVDQLFGAWVAQHEREHVLKTLAALQVPAAPINDASAVANDPHFAERHLARVPDGERDVLMPIGPFRIDGEPAVARHAGPAKGTSNDEILGDRRHLSAENHAALRAPHPF
ncbi:CaiB/BaiF CoA transferase family protein [Aeromicrobium sp. CTD01-1L150]|uniref:CaiB/BaiF CoA transferase family protein n=1 Tax=Aeromicrobium sp. CTD01-1L150 TaxID=3341830 RepID=UPI0035C0699E